jgi:four helix bundle protein
MGRSNFRDLAAYELAAELADDVYRLVAGWRSFDRWSLGIQLVRASDSVGANIAEASGRWSRGDGRRLFLIARGSLYEVEHWVLRAQSRGLVSSDLTPRLNELARTLNGLIRSQHVR